jgi:hypothetical protein
LNDYNTRESGGWQIGICCEWNRGSYLEFNANVNNREWGGDIYVYIYTQYQVTEDVRPKKNVVKDGGDQGKTMGAQVENMV